MTLIKQCWSESKIYRGLLIAAAIYFVLRLALQFFLFAEAITPQAIAEGRQVSADLQLSYIPSAQHFQAGEDLYLKGSLEEVIKHYLYSPIFAFLYGPLLLLPLNIQVPLMGIIHVVCYALLYIWWARIFKRSKLPHVEKAWAWYLPFFLIYTAFWDDIAILNTYLIVALYATFAIDAILEENLGWAAFWLGFMIMPMKPQWAFPLAIPLLLGRYRFFFKVVGATVVTYLIAVGLTVSAGGAAYVIQQYKDYIEFLGRLPKDYPWWSRFNSPFFGYNHSVKQIVLYYLGISPITMQLATLTKLALLIPLGLVGMKFLRQPPYKSGYEAPETALTLTFALYLGAFIWLDMVWEVSLAIVIFAFLRMVLKETWQQRLLWLAFLPYGFLEPYRTFSVGIFGFDIVVLNTYVTTDPFTYFPLMMVMLLIFYSLLIQKLSHTKTPVL